MSCAAILNKHLAEKVDDSTAAALVARCMERGWVNQPPKASETLTDRIRSLLRAMEPGEEFTRDIVPDASAQAFSFVIGGQMNRTVEMVRPGRGFGGPAIYRRM